METYQWTKNSYAVKKWMFITKSKELPWIFFLSVFKIKLKNAIPLNMIKTSHDFLIISNSRVYPSRGHNGAISPYSMYVLETPFTTIKADDPVRQPSLKNDKWLLLLEGILENLRVRISDPWGKSAPRKILF